MKSNESEALAKRRKHYGPESKGAICPRALCQQFSRIALSNRISVIKSVAVAQRLAGDDGRGQKTVGGERLQSLAAERFDVSRGVRRLQQPGPFYDGSFWPLREAAAEEDLCIFSGAAEENISAFICLMGCSGERRNPVALRGGEGSQLIYVTGAGA